VARVGADDSDAPVASDDPTLVAHLLDAWSYLHFDRALLWLRCMSLRCLLVIRKSGLTMVPAEGNSWHDLDRVTGCCWLSSGK
jgi:hypothetical protein